MKHDCMIVPRGDPLVQAYGLGAMALRYQALGLAVLPLAFGSKRPHKVFEAAPGHPGGVALATMDPAMVPWCWGRYPMAGVGIATGPASRLVVVDLDVRHGEDGPANFARQSGIRDPAAMGYPVVATPSGGWHVYMRLPAGRTLPGRTSIVPGVDIKAGGGYVAAPPTHLWYASVGPEGGGAWLGYRLASGCFCTIPGAPPWLMAWIEATPGTGQEGNGDDTDLAAIAEHGLEKGQRNTQLHRLACSLFARMGTTPAGQSAVRAVLDGVLAATADRSGFGRAEIERTIASALRFVQQAEEARMPEWREWRDFGG